MQRTLLLLILAALCSPALAQQRPRAQTPAPAQSAPPHSTPPATAQNAAPAQAPAQTPAPDAAATPPAADQQRTTATFGDWVLRCLRPEKVPPTCEVTQTLVDKGKAVAQTAIGHAHAGEPLRLAMAVPPNANLTTQPKLVGKEGDTTTPAIELTWRRCIPTACIADTELNDETMRQLRARTENGRVLFQDAGGREIALPFGPNGLSQALDAMAKEG